jgi:undecaprenyl-diphosphatase
MVRNTLSGNGMASAKVPAMSAWIRLSDAELSLCTTINGLCRIRGVGAFFAAVSRLGDGVFWYTCMALLPMLYGRHGVATSLRMLAVAAAGVTLYRIIKTCTARPRPCSASDAISLGAAPLDRYSFPSGHTLHAVAFTMVACSHHPLLLVVLAPFAVLVAMSRIILGLHYPTDVASGAVIGMLVALPAL